MHITRFRGPLHGAWAALLLAGGCVESVEVDEAETALEPPPIAEFDPAARVVPLPNALLMDAATGRVNVPPACGEQPDSAAAGLRAALNRLDGFGTSRLSLVATFSEPVAADSLEGRVALVRLTERGVPVSPPEGPVAIDVLTSSSLRQSPDCSTSQQVPAVVIRPRAPLREASTYGVLFARGVTTEDGDEFQPSVTWALVRQEQAPVAFAPDAAEAEPPLYHTTPFDPAEPEELATLRGLDLLWRGHAPLLAAADALAPLVLPGAVGSRDDLLLAWAFDTQSISDPFDPGVAGSPASRIDASAAPLAVPAPAAGAGASVSVEELFAAALPGVSCETLGCAAIGAVYAAGPVSTAPSFTSSSYLAGDDCTQPASAAASFDDPVAPTFACERQVPVLVVVPAAPPPTSGYPTVIFAHGIGRSKEDLLALAGTLAGAGIASVAMDALDHGVRALQISSDAALGCDGVGAGRPCEDVFGPTCAPQCFAPLLSADLPRTRDHLRQTALDHRALSTAIAACAAPGACGTLQVDPARIGYVGQSLGALIGGVSVAVSPEVSGAVLNVGAADWLQVLSETQTLALRCPLVDRLIESGVIPGQTWALGANPSATCVGDAWRAEPGYLAFEAAARWLLDPVDPVNFTSVLDGVPAVLVSEVVGDRVVPNAATLTFANALGLVPSEAAVATSVTPDPTPAALAPGSAWIRYQNLDADPATMFPGNGYDHGSLLAPAAPSATMVSPSGELGTIRMRTDAVAFLSSHLGGTP